MLWCSVMPHASMVPRRYRGVTAMSRAIRTRHGRSTVHGYGREAVHPALRQVRETEFPMVREYTYLNTASQGPWPTRTIQAVHEDVTAMAYVNTPRGIPETAQADQKAREKSVS